MNPNTMDRSTFRLKTSRLIRGLLGITTLMISAPATSQDRLADHLIASRSQSLDVREARALADQSGSVLDEARGRLLPSLTATGSYTRNELEVAVTIPTGEALVRLSSRPTINGTHDLSCRFH